MRNMENKIIILFCLIVLTFYSYSQYNCSQKFSSYSSAKKYVENSNFQLKDETDCSASSWIREAKFYSCDSKFGYFKFKTNSKTYIHEKLPINVWYQFKNASSKGSFYNQFIKHKYRLVCDL